MRMICLFAGEFGPYNSIGSETVNRCLAALKFFQKNPDSIILMAAGPNLLDKASPLHCQLMYDFLIAKGVPPQQAIICGSAQSTTEEIEAMANYQCKELVSEIYVVSSWYHLPRILFLWQQKKHIKTYPVPAWDFSFYSLKRAALEPLKFILPFLKLPAPFQKKIKFLLSRFGLT